MYLRYNTLLHELCISQNGPFSPLYRGTHLQFYWGLFQQGYSPSTITSHVSATCIYKRSSQIIQLSRPNTFLYWEWGERQTDRQTDRQTGIKYCCSPKYSYISDIVLAFLFTVSLHSSSIAYTVFQWVLNQQNIVYLKLFRKGLENIVWICNLIHVIIELFTLVQMSSGSKFPSVNKLQVLIRFISNTLQVIVFFYC